MEPQMDSDSAPAADSRPTPLSLLSLLPDLRAIIIRALTRDAARTLAATTSAALQDVLEARSDLRTFTVPRALARIMAQLRFDVKNSTPAQHSTPAQQCTATATTTHQNFEVAVSFPLHAAPLICAEQQQRRPNRRQPLLLWFSPFLVFSATLVEVDSCTERGQPLPALSFPPGMINLSDVRVRMCKLSVNWLPPSSCGSVRELRVVDSNFDQMSHLPEGMHALERLYASNCRGLERDWLPQSSRGSVRELVALSSSIQNVPVGMRQLERLSICTGAPMDADWLPESSRQRVRVLELRDGLREESEITGVPARMPALEAVILMHCDCLSKDWLPSSSRKLVRVLCLWGCTARAAIPAGLRSLQAVLLLCCMQPGGQNWLPATSLESVRSIHAVNTGIVGIPEGMGALKTLFLLRCNNLTGEWLPASSCQRVEVLGVGSSSIVRLPADMCALSDLIVQECPSLDADWLPESSTTAVHSVTAAASILQRLPDSVTAPRTCGRIYTNEETWQLVKCDPPF